MVNATLENLLKQARQRREAQQAVAVTQLTVTLPALSDSLEKSLYCHPIHGTQLNEKQSEFLSLIREGKSCILIGAAGTGKTYTMQAALHALIQAGHVPQYHHDGHKHLQNATHGIVITAFTRRAVANIRKNLSKDLAGSCITVHATLEYAPEYFEILDPVTNEYRNTMRFSPSRSKMNQLDNSIKFCIIEESSMLGTDLFKELQDALPLDCKYIFLGDIQQLPPVFGPAILGYKMLELPLVELTQVYRQALDSPIIALAHRILSGKPMPLAELEQWNTLHSSNGLTFKPIQKKLHAEHITPRIANFLKAEIASGALDLETDTILIPFNKGLGTIEINKEIAQYLTQLRNVPTYEIISGFMKHYYAVGDKILYEKEDAEIISINRNALYYGNKLPRSESLTLDRWGFDTAKSNELGGELSDDDFNFDGIDTLLATMNATGAEKEERKNEASHCITIRMKEDGEEITLSKAAEINALLLGYALTVHKSQGSEWRKVYLILHQSHNTMISRELLYTAVTRARKELFIVCEKDTFEKGIISQKVKGNTIAEKALYFQGRREINNGY